MFGIGYGKVYPVGYQFEENKLYPIPINIDGSIPAGGPVYKAARAAKYFFSSNGFRGPTQRYAPGASFHGISEKVFISDDYWTWAPRFLFTNWYMTTSGSGGQEAVCGNAVNIDGVTLLIGLGATPLALTFDGAATTIIADDSEAWTDGEDSVMIPPRTVCRLRVAWNVTNSSNFVCAPAQGISPMFGDRAENSATTLAAKLTAGGISTSLPSGNNQYMYTASAMAAKGNDGRPVVLCIGTSIGAGVGCSRLVKGSFGEQGPSGLGMVSTLNGAPRLPAANFCVSGGLAAGITAKATGLAKRFRAFALLPNLPFDAVDSEFGTNDQTATFSSWKSIMDAMWAACKEAWPTAKLVQSTMWSRVTSTDAFVTVANQTLSSNWAFPAGSAWTMYSYMKNLADGKIDHVIDIQDDIDNLSGGGVRGKWRVDVLGATPWATTISSSPSGGATSFTAAAQPRIGSALAIADGTHEAIIVLSAPSTAAPFTINTLSALAGAHTSGAALKETISTDGTHPGDLIASRVAQARARAKLEGAYGSGQ